jgi:hypothetical protein
MLSLRRVYPVRRQSVRLKMHISHWCDSQRLVRMHAVASRWSASLAALQHRMQSRHDKFMTYK